MCSHRVIIVTKSLLEIFDPNEPDYSGTRDHFTTQELAKIDEIRARDPNAPDLTFLEKIFVSYVIDKAIFSAAD